MSDGSAGLPQATAGEGSGGDQVANHTKRRRFSFEPKGKPMTKKMKRNSQSLRDILFDEIEELRSGTGDPSRALAISNLAKQIINVAKVELEFHKQVIEYADQGHSIKMGEMQLGSLNAPSADETATARPSLSKATRHDDESSLPTN